MSAEINAQMSSSSFLVPHTYPGRLITAEGLDGSGKSTQLQLLSYWLQAEGYEVLITEWTPSKLIRRALKAGKKQGYMDPMLLSILHAADLAELYERDIVPALQRGAIVLADRYMYTAFARDAARGLSPSWVRSLYRFSVQPDVVFYLHISPEEAVRRRLTLQQQQQGQLGDSRSEKNSKSGKKDKEHKQNRKLGKEQSPYSQATIGTPSPQLTQEALESFRNFEIKMYSEYQQMQKEFGFTVIEGNQSIEQVQALLRRAVGRLLLG